MIVYFLVMSSKRCITVYVRLVFHLNCKFGRCRSLEFAFY